MADGLYDLGLLTEYHYDSREDVSIVPFQDDLFLGLRFGFNDAESSEILIGAIIDQQDQTTSFRIEGNRRVFGDARIILETQIFTDVDPDNAIYYLRDSDFVRLSLELFF
jgi:hypothetical protein